MKRESDKEGERKIESRGRKESEGDAEKLKTSEKKEGGIKRAS